MTAPRAGDRYLWSPPLANFGTVHVRILRVYSDGHAAALCHRPGGRSWHKRFPLPLWPSLHPVATADGPGLVDPGPHRDGCPVWATRNGDLDDTTCDCDTPGPGLVPAGVALPCDADQERHHA